VTVPVQETRFPHTGNGVTVEFAYGCQIQSPSDLIVSVDGAIVPSGFTVSGVGAATGGSVTFDAAPLADTEVLLERIIQLQRITDYQQNGDFLARVVNPDFDRLWMALQQFESLLGIQPGSNPRALLLGRNDTNGSGAYRALQNRIQDLADPEGLQDAANKRWTLTQLAQTITDGSGNALLQLLAASTGTEIIGTIASGSGAIPRTQQAKNRDTINAKDYGMASANTAAQNMAALKLAVAACPIRGKLVISDDGGIYNLDTTGGLSAACVVDKRMSIQIDGHIKANFGTMQANPPYIFKVTAAGVSFVGAGTIAGDGSIDDTNAGTDATFPGLIYVTGNRFSMTGVMIDTPPKVGVMLMNCKYARIDGVNFIGGPTAYVVEHTAYFGVRAYLGSHHRINGCNFAPGDNGGKFVNCIFFLNTNYCTISGNTADGVWEKLAYLYGSYNRIFGNEVNDSTITDSFRIYGSYNKLSGNHAVAVNGGTQVFDGVHNEVSGNTFIGCRQIGINVGRSDPTYTGGFSGTKVVNNTCIGVSGTITDGIRVWVDGASSGEIKISDNTLSNFSSVAGDALINLKALGAYTITNSKISGNILDSGLNGIILDRVIDSMICENQARNISNSFLNESNGAGNSWLNNRGVSIASIGINGLDASSSGRGNQYTRAPLTGSVTLSAAVTTTVMHGGVAPNARIFIQETNTAAGLAVVNKGRLLANKSGVNFELREPNGTAAGGTETFDYEIIQ
jgi:parallel beta-helix repeat protein